MMFDYESQMRLAGHDRQLRAAAESVLSASINSQRGSYAQSIRTPDTVNDLFIGSSRYNSRTWNIRSFCIFVTFDFFFTVIMWLVCIVISGANVQSAFIQQIVHYNMTTSLFDIVIAAAIRFIILLLFYAICYMDHWCMVALSTSSTCAFLVAKVFLYDWSQSSQPVFQVLLILISFVLVWGEVWFSDRKVNSLQSHSRDWYTDHMNSERGPLLSPNYAVATAPLDNAGHFYTPIGSPDHSDNEDEVDQKGKGSNAPFHPATIAIKPSQDMIDEFRKRGPTLLSKCFNLITSDNWKTETITAEGDVISCMMLPKPAERKIFKIWGIVDYPALKLVNDLFDNVESSTSWNKQVNESKKLFTIDENTDLLYQATKALGEGKISARDFVVLRYKGQCESYHMSCWVSVNFVPTRKNFVRGENGISCFATQSLANGPTEKSQFVWLLNTNLKGWLPQKLVNMSTSKALIEFINALRHHTRTLKGD